MFLGLVRLVLILEPVVAVSLVTVTRQVPADQFLIPGRCRDDSCVVESSGTAESFSGCHCKCLPHAPVFREDLQLCVDEIHECPIAPFAVGTAYQKVPYVFLPLRGQIIFPSAEIAFIGVKSPICVISNAKYLSPDGWVQIKNGTDREPPFRLYRDESRSYLQWWGDTALRISMEGRLLLVQMMCKDGATGDSSIFAPCVSFRVAGTPSGELIAGGNRWTGIKEVSFSGDPTDGRVRGGEKDAEDAAGDGGMGGGNGGEEGVGYLVVVLISACLCLAYGGILGIFYLKSKGNTDRHEKSSSPPLSVHIEEGIIKNNPLLTHSDSYPPVTSSDSDDCSDIFQLADENSCDASNNVQVTSAVVHPRSELKESTEPRNERLPEENVSIVETLEDKSAFLGQINGRRKLYFNPAYFEHDLLLAPPPAAIEFLIKIREVMSIAKAKMESKRFLPSLLGIAEEKEDTLSQDCVSCKLSTTHPPQQPASEANSFDNSGLGCCHNCSDESKQKSIQDWLETVVVSKPSFSSMVYQTGASRSLDLDPVSRGSMGRTEKSLTFYNSDRKEEEYERSETSTQEPPSTNEMNSSCKYDKFQMKVCRDEYTMNYECITDNACKELGLGIDKSEFPTPTEYADIRLSPVVFSGFSKSANSSEADDHIYEMIMVSDECKSLPELYQNGDTHSFISEVYVNNNTGCGYPRSDSSIQSCDSSTNSLLKKESDDNRHLTITVDDPAPILEDLCDSDSFEPDTLDRKPNKLTINATSVVPSNITIDFFTDSLERAPQISLKSSGSFKNNAVVESITAAQRNNRGVSLNRAFGSLREIFVAKNRYNQCNHTAQVFSSLLGSTKSLNQVSNFRWSKERYKTLKPESKQAKRQRPPSPLNHLSLPPVPLEEEPEVTDAPVSSQIVAYAVANKGIGKVRESVRLFDRIPELVTCRKHESKQRGCQCTNSSTTSYEVLPHLQKDNNNCQLFVDKETTATQGVTMSKNCHRTEDSGYLSTDSNNSDKGAHREGSETDDSFYDGASESGAESIATDSFSFGKNLKHTTPLQDNSKLIALIPTETY